MPIATRRFLTMHFNPKYTTPNVTRKHSSLDFAPTVLETMGFHLEGHRLGFGTSLLSPENTIVEKQIPRMAIRSFRELSGSIEYNNLFQNKAP